MSLTRIIIELSVYISLVAVISGMVRFRKLSKVQVLLFWLLVLTTTNQLISEALIYFHVTENNLPFFHFYILFEFCFVAVIYRILMGSASFTKVILFAFIVFVAVYLYQVTLPNGLWKYPTYSHFTESLLILTFSGYYFYQTFKKGTVINLFKEVGFWISTGTFIYFSSNCLLFLFSEFVLTLSNPSYQLIWTVHAFLTILLYIAYTIAIQCKTNHNLS